MCTFVGIYNPNQLPRKIREFHIAWTRIVVSKLPLLEYNTLHVHPKTASGMQAVGDMWWIENIIPFQNTLHFQLIFNVKAGNKNPLYNTSSHQGAVMQGAMYPTADANQSLNSGLINCDTTDSCACSNIGSGSTHWLIKSAILKNHDDTKYPPIVHLKRTLFC